MEEICNAGLLSGILARACDAGSGAQPLREARLVSRAWREEAKEALQNRRGQYRFGDCITGDDRMARSCAWCHHDPALFVATFHDGSLRFFDALTGRCTHRLEIGGGASCVVAPRRNGRGEARPLLCVTPRHHQSGAALVTLPRSSRDGAPTVRRLREGFATANFADGGDLLCILSFNRVLVYDTRTLDVVFACSTEGFLEGVLFSPSGASLVLWYSRDFIMGRDAAVCVVSTSTWATRKFTPFHRITGVKWTPGAPLLVAGNDYVDEDERAFAWGEDGGPGDIVAEPGPFLFSAVAWTADGTIVHSRQPYRGRFIIVRANGAMTKVRLRIPYPDTSVLHVCVSPDGRALLAILRKANQDGILSVFPVPE